MATFSPTVRKRIYWQVALMVLVILIGGILGAYLISQDVLPSQFTLKQGEAVPRVEVPQGFQLTVLADGLAAPRYVAVHPATGIPFVSERGGGRVLALPDANKDQRVDELVVVAENLVAPTGLAFDGDWLYVAEGNQVSRFQIGEDLRGHSREVIIRDLPGGRNQGEVDPVSHALLIDGDDLYVTVGAGCVDCLAEDSRRAALLAYDLDGSNERIFARGLYYSLGMAINPITEALWVSVQGRPQLDDVPEALYIVENGDDAGFPYCHAGSIIDPALGGPDACESVLQPLLTFAPQANVTSILFYDNPAAPAAYQHDLLVVLHGGVNAAEEQLGMSILRLDIDPATGNPLGQGLEEFAGGWWISEEPGDWLGRPFALAQAADGRLYITDDGAGAVYELRYNPD